MKVRIFILLGIISIVLFIGCESDWYPIYEDWLCTINVDGTDLEYIRNSYGNFLLSPDRQTLIEYTKNKFYSVDLNDISSRTILLDYGDDTEEIYNPSMSNTHIAFTHSAEIYSLNIETKDTTRLTFDDVLEINAAFSSDGYLQKINVDGTGHTLITDTNNWEFDAVISPHGQKILYSKEDFPYIIDADGTGSYKLIDKMIADKDYEYRESYFLNDNEIMLTLKKQIN